MMGTNHALSGAAVWLTLTTPLAGNPLVTVDTPTLVAGTLLTAGAALLPDIDHPNSTLAHAGGAATQAVARAAQTMSGGHRHGMHSLLAVAGFAVLAWAATQFTVTVAGQENLPVGGMALTVFLIVGALKALKIRRWTGAPVWGLALTVAAGIGVFAPQLAELLPTIVAVGVITHIVGDMLTEGGVPLLWPVVITPPRAWNHTPVLSHVWKPNGYLAAPILGRTGSWREWVLSALMTGYCLLVAWTAMS